MSRTVVLAFSGGLDTTYCAVWLRTQGWNVHAVTVNTGGFDSDELAAIEQSAARAGVSDYTLIDGRRELFDLVLRNLIFANALRGGVYPLCVSAERSVQARRCAEFARQCGASALAHGSTGAGNDQVRFDAGFAVFAPGLPILTPIRDQALSREQETDWLRSHGIDIPPKTTRYSINRGLWGVTIGGGATHRSDGALPEDAWVLTREGWQSPPAPRPLTIDFQRGVPAALDGAAIEPVALIERLNELAGAHGVGRGVHLGDTILGIKGRVAFEAPAAVTLITAHRELEKLVLSRQQLFWKQTLGDLYGANVHEARAFDPLQADLEAFFESSQRHVTGRVTLELSRGQAIVVGVDSPHSLLGGDSRYGETSALWSGAEAAGFCKLYGLPAVLAARRDERGGASSAS